MRNIRKLVIHCDASRPSNDFDIEDIRRMHKGKPNYYNDVGYHWFIKRDGTLQKGRDESVTGAHVRGHNWYSIGICMAGGLNQETWKPEDNYTDEQYATLIALLLDLSLKYPDAEVLGHRDFRGVRKECPCYDVIPWWAGVLEDIFKDEKEENNLEPAYKYNYIVGSDTPLFFVSEDQIHSDSVIHIEEVK